MKTLHIKGSSGDSLLKIGESIKNLHHYVPEEKTVIITDTNVREHYGNEFPPYEIIEIGTGEGIKTLDTIAELLDKLVELEVDRSGFIVGIGGGIVCDITGFVASTYMRGIRFGFVSSTLLSQVDASVGGKNGVNYKGYKNMVGVFQQPEFVICDMNLLKTLPEKEVLSGMGEIVKHGAIADLDLLSFLEEHNQEALSLKPDVIERLVYDSVVIKSDIVNRDEKESGVRKKLNFGHTFGHAVEKVTNLRHGEAISIGMVVAANLSEKRGLLQAKEVKRLKNLLTHLKLPTTTTFHKEEILDALKKDKKREGDSIDFILLHGLGKAIIEKITIKELEDVVMTE